MTEESATVTAALSVAEHEPATTLARAVEGVHALTLRSRPAKSSFLHIRVSERQREDMKAVAERHGLTVSALLLGLFEHAKGRL